MEEELFVDKHRLALVQRVKNIGPILDGLLSYKVINREHYEEILSLHGPQEKMRALLRGPLRVCGPGGKEIFYKLLRKHESDLLDDLADESEKYKKNKKDMEVESMMAQKILLESLNGLSSDELNQFKSLIELEESFPLILRGRLKVANTDETVDLMVKTFSGKCVNMTKTVLKKMNRTDLVQRLSDISSGTKEEPLPSLIQSVETTASVIELLLETLKDLSDQNLESFKRVLSQILSDKGNPHISPRRLMMSDRQDMVFYLVQDHSDHRLLEMTTEAFEKMNRTDLVQRLSQSSSGPKKKHSEAQRPAVIQKVATMAAVKHLLLETLNDLRNEDLEKFKQTLDLIVSKKKQRYFSWIWSSSPDRAQTVKQMMEIFGQQCVEITMEVLKDINRTDLRQRLTKPSSELKEMYSVDEHRPAQSEGAPIAAEKEILLKTLKDLSDDELHRFQWLLQFTFFQKSISSFHGYPYWTASALQLVDQMVDTCGPQSVEVTREVLMDMNRTDLVERLSETILRLKDIHFLSSEMYSVDEHRPAQSEEDSSGWTKLEPEVNSTDEDEASTYSLKSEAGNFECSVSGLRWVCQEKVSFKYKFCSSEEPMKRMEMMKYMPAGPLIDITVISGKLFEVYLPHWICIDDIPKILQKFAVLHIDDCGDVVEKVSEVTSSHVKLSEPVFSPRAVLMKMGFPVKIHCNVLIYSKLDTSCILLHVYLTPLDPALEETMDKKKKDFKLIQKPRPNECLTLHQDFNLTADITTAQIGPKKITLRYESQEPNFYEVYIENPDSYFHLTLSQLNKGKRKPQCEPVWSCEIRKVDLRNSGDSDVKETCGQPSITGPWDMEHSSDEMQGVASVTTTKERLLKMLEDLGQEEFNKCKWYLRDSDVLAGLPRISCSQLENSNILDLVDLMSQTYSQKSLEVTKKIFQKINRNDLVQKLSDIGSGSKAEG
ncbi:uncharacterized protein LOC117500511 isoform X2 [Trematomus bernacchii]|uniref:uncharacterized protein LOC117500511 isoform X2 n=1 Tax=Trematomus bernacchii TaxID=40690 RepID=UPI00146BB712|nr:uncharacterized protein LOC117500511 isoform X2 [Trematomus bernacchii]